MPVPPVLRDLLTAPGPSGYEQAPAQVFRAACEAFGAEVTHDAVGSTVARVKGSGDGLTVAVVGHIDEIGVIVRHIDDQGFLWFAGVGGWDPVILVGQRVEVSTREGRIPGVVGKKPIHLLKDDERKSAPELKNLHIDIGAKDGDEARSLVRVGDVAVIAGEPVELPNDRIVSRSMDNRLGCYVAYESARLVSEQGGATGDVCAVAVTQEETTFGGAHTTAYTLRPDVAIVVDVGDHARLDAEPGGVRAAGGDGRSRRHPVHPGRGRARDQHGRGRLPHLAWRDPVWRDLDSAALHALAGRDGPARGRGQHRSSHRRVRPPAAGRR
jgi:putative aminopeptidase FrvX